MSRNILALGVWDREAEDQPDVEARGALVPGREGRDCVGQGVVERHCVGGLAVFKCTMTRTRLPGATLNLPVSCVGTGRYWGQRGMQPAATSADSSTWLVFSSMKFTSPCLVSPAQPTPHGASSAALHKCQPVKQVAPSG